MADGTPQVAVSVPKSPLQSKIIVVNLITLLLGAADQTLSLLQPSMRTEVYGLALLALTTANMLFRLYTTQPVEFMRLFGMGTPAPTQAELDAARTPPTDQAGFALGEVLGVLIGFGLCLALAFTAGMRHTEQRFAADQAGAVQAATEVLRNQVDEANQAATEARTQVGALQVAEVSLQAQLKQMESAHVPLIAQPRPRACPTATLVPAAVPEPNDQAAAGGGLVLTADAVRLWDAALRGDVRDPADPAGAAGPTADAGAAATLAGGQLTSLTPADAWANHITNAASCAQDRVRFVALQRVVRNQTEHQQ